MVRKRRPGFTLIELLLVIGIIAILASIVIVAINPTKQLASARNAQRHSDVNTIVNAVYQYAIDKNSIPSTIPNDTGTGSSVDVICRMDSKSAPTGNNCINLRMLSGTYVVGIPQDPQNPNPTTSTGTSYWIFKNSTTNRITVVAPLTETPETYISVSR